jgi:predicted AAA+ superfamily ATPase
LTTPEGKVAAVVIVKGVTGTGRMSNVKAFEAPIVGDGLRTVTEAAPSAATSLAGIDAVS